MKLISRNENGKLFVHSLDLEIFIGDLFANCKTESEIEFVKDAIIGATEIVAEDYIEELS